MRTTHRCVEMGTWILLVVHLLSSTAFSENIECEKPSPPENGEIFFTDNSESVGSQIEYICDEHHILEPITSQFAICTVYGIWSSPKPRCIKMCKVGDLSHGSIRTISGFLRTITEGSYVHDNTTLFFTCNDGYERYVSDYETLGTLKCVNGTLRPGSPECRPKRCFIAPTTNMEYFIEQEKVLENYIHGGIVMNARCSNKTELFRSSSYLERDQVNVMCYLGTLKPESLVCKDKRCNIIETIDNGQFINRGIAVGKGEKIISDSKIQMTCSKGYELYNKTNSTYLRLEQIDIKCYQGSFTSEIPSCEPKRCNITQIENGKLVNGASEIDPRGMIGSNISISLICSDGFELYNESISMYLGSDKTDILCYEGSFNVAFPKCNPKRCKQPVLTEAVTGFVVIGNKSRPDKYFPHGQSLEAVCKDGYRQQGHFTCQKGIWTGNSTCEPAASSVEIRLYGGSGPYEGRLEVNYNGTWGTVCDDSFDTKDGAVVCRQLGYSGTGVITQSGAFYGPGSGPIWLDDLNCTGLENNLIRCGHRGWGKSDCAHSEDASVICPCQNRNPMVRLSGGLRQSQGRVEVLYNGRWGRVCDDNFDNQAATVVCRMLCYTGNLFLAKKGGFFRPGTGSFYLDNVVCNGNETSIVNCRHNPWGQNNCGHNEDAGVDCQANNLPNIQIRLAGGPNSQEGRVEIQYNGQWGTVCDDDWSVSDAAVACRMLGLPFDGAVPISQAAYGNGSGPIIMDDVQCIGTEATLAACQFAGWTINDCKHSEDASVICQSSTASVPIRLSGGSGPYEGRLEVNYNGTWGTVCDDSFDTHDGVVVCRQLGYPGTDVITKSDAFFGPGSGPIWLDDLHCTSLENNLIMCGHRGWGKSNCGHSKDTSVICPCEFPPFVNDVKCMGLFCARDYLKHFE